MELKFQEKFFVGSSNEWPTKLKDVLKSSMTMFLIMILTIIKNVFGAELDLIQPVIFFNDFREDIKLMKAAGLKSIRTSIQWSRLIDDLEKNTVNEKAVDFYNAVINEFIAQGIRPMINLNHFDLPVELLKTYGGWESPHVVDL